MKNNKRLTEIKENMRSCPPVLPPSVLCTLCRIGKNHVYQLLKDGDITSLLYRGRRMVLKKSVMDYLLAHPKIRFREAPRKEDTPDER